MKCIVNWKPKIEEDERLHTEWMNSILHQGQAETARLRPQLVQEGELPRAIVELTGAEANTPLTEMAS